MLSYEEIIKLADARVIAYSSLSRLLRREVDRELLSSFTKTPPVSGKTDEDEPAGNETPGTALFSYVKLQIAQGQTLESIFHSLATDYTGLFLLGYTSVHPYESVYTSSRGIMMQQAFQDARKHYAALGFSPSEASREMADHISVELEFMAWLAISLRDAIAASETETAQDLLTRQISFHDVHLHWVKKLSDDMQKRAKTDFYREVARLLDSVVSSDSAFMASINEFLSQNGSPQTTESAKVEE